MSEANEQNVEQKMLKRVRLSTVFGFEGTNQKVLPLLRPSGSVG